MSNDRRLKILMLEDSEDDAILIKRVLTKEKIDFSDERVDTRDEFVEAINRFKPDVVLSDHGLPGFNSREALRICLREKSNTPFILVTGTVTDEYAVSCLREGADDYILKSNLSRLPSAILGAVKKRKLEKLKREARHALRQQNTELIKVNQELDNFVYSVSHNLRGPLASVMGLLNIALSEKDPPAISSLLRMMQSSVHKLDGTLHEILEFARNARHDVHLGEVDWMQVISSCFHRLEYLDPGKKIDCDIILHTETPFFSDGARLKVVLTNLLSNAMVFRAPKPPQIVTIEVHVTEKDATILVRDNGIGIPEHVMPRIFDMFYRGTEQSHGAGLGLYIVREIINKLSGSVMVTSKEREGTKIVVTIPNVRSCDLA